LLLGVASPPAACAAVQEKIQLLAVDATAQAAARARDADAWKQTGLGQPPAQAGAAAAAAGRPSSSARRGSRTTPAAKKGPGSRSAAAAVADKNQRKLTEVMPMQVDFAAGVQADTIAGSVQRLVERVQEEDQGGSSQQQGGSGDEHLVPGSPRLDLLLDTPDEDGGAAAAAAGSDVLALLPPEQQQQQHNVEVVDISSDSDPEEDVVQVQQQQQQQQPRQTRSRQQQQQQQQQPVAPSPWPATGPAAEKAQRTRAQELRAGVQALVSRSIDGDDELPAGLASWQQQGSPAKGRQRQQQQQGMLGTLTNFTAVGFSKALAEFAQGQPGVLPASHAPQGNTAAGVQQPLPIPKGLMPYGDDGTSALTARSGATESIATGPDDAAANGLQEDVTSPTRPAAPPAAAQLAAAAAAPSPAASGRSAGHGRDSKQPTARAAKLLTQIQRPTRSTAVGAAQG
jgi:hypothetical protein